MIALLVLYPTLIDSIQRVRAIYTAVCRELRLARSLSLYCVQHTDVGWQFSVSAKSHIATVMGHYMLVLQYPNETSQKANLFFLWRRYHSLEN